METREAPQEARRRREPVALATCCAGLVSLGRAVQSVRGGGASSPVAPVGVRGYTWTEEAFQSVWRGGGGAATPADPLPLPQHLDTPQAAEAT